MNRLTRSVVTLLAGLLCFTAAQCGMTPAKLSLVPGVSLPLSGEVRGLDLGILATQTDDVSGLQLAPLYAGSRGTFYGFKFGLVSKSVKAVGLQLGIIAIADRVNGVEEGLIYASAERVDGILEGIYTSAGEVNGIQEGFITDCDRMSGVQYGYVNIAGVMQGVQFGLVNVADETHGLQLGVVNVTKTMKGVQVGAINIITHSRVPAMILANMVF